MKRATLQELLGEANQLKEFATAALKSKSWVSYEKHLGTFNRLLQKAYQVNTCRELYAIAPVPRWSSGSPSHPSETDREKLIEIVQKSRLLYDTLTESRIIQ
jgi:hypothetical protein